MDKKTEGYLYLQMLQDVVVTLSQSALSDDELLSIGKIMDSIKCLIDLWQNKVPLNENTIQTDPDTHRRILGHLTLIFSYLQDIENYSLVASDMNWQYFNELITKLNHIIFQCDVIIEA